MGQLTQRFSLNGHAEKRELLPGIKLRITDMKMNDKNDKDSPSVVSFSLRIDTELKRQFEQFCDDVGISMTAAFTLFAKKVVREQRIPFEISAEPPQKEGEKG